ncbi:hypothetical protein [Leifsonia sp. NCR5]|uniref:hypothetical protein n=1 Tax=Leifsonia sp. NCR5 TaxID=1978342 RepID=UPI000A190085|nr:hypothetical protein [Leifsonia sp. NCR5]
MHDHALFLNGTVGVGKTATADAISRILIQRGIPHAIIDLDALRAAWPAPEGDPFNNALELANLRAVAANHRAAGARILVLAGVIEDPDAVPLYRDAVGGLPFTVVRLTVGPAVGEARLRARHGDDHDALAWHLHRHGELDAVLDAARIPGPVVDTTGRSPSEVAEAVLAASAT